MGDPGWHWKSYSKKGMGRSAAAHYDTMTVDEIMRLPVADYAPKSCVLFLWVTDPFVMAAREVIEAWGFTYKTVGFYWVKLNKNGEGYWRGMGKWARCNPEQCLLATRGSPEGGFVRDHDVDKLIIAPRRVHSRKPDEIYSRIERLVKAEPPFLELFARFPRAGWDTAFSDQIETGPTPRRWKSNSYPGDARATP
jgi:N6-adenosine-specific RNA methylase IME4